jgi:hypothetical protein
LTKKISLDLCVFLEKNKSSVVIANTRCGMFVSFSSLWSCDSWFISVTSLLILNKKHAVGSKSELDETFFRRAMLQKLEE